MPIAGIFVCLTFVTPQTTVAWDACAAAQILQFKGETPECCSTFPLLSDTLRLATPHLALVLSQFETRRVTLRRLRALPTRASA